MIGYFHRSLILIIGLTIASCSFEPDAPSIIDKAIAEHGGENYTRAKIEFTFRGRGYTASRQGSRYEYTRRTVDSSGVTLDKLNNEGFQRTMNGESVPLPEERKNAYSNSINSVIYFALLPYALNDAAVIKKYLGETTINGEPYHEIHVSFKKEGGGEDYEDTFVYWIHQQKNTMDYLAYKFHVDGGGTRFREATNARVVNGIRFADYNNFEGPEEGVPLHELDRLFKEGKLKKISEIDLENIKVQLLDGEPLTEVVRE